MALAVSSGSMRRPWATDSTILSTASADLPVRSWMDAERHTESFGVGEARQDVVDRDAWRKFVRHGFGPRGHRTEGCWTARCWNGFLHRGRDDLDDSPEPFCLHAGNSGFHQRVGGVQMPSKGSVEVASLFSKGPPGATCVVDENVNGPQGLGCRRKGRGKHVGVLQVEHQRLVASAAQVPSVSHNAVRASPFRAQTVMSAPAFASILAVASPMPLLAPHTKACFP